MKKKGWDIKKLGEVCTFINGFAFKSSKFTESGEPIIRISDIQNGMVVDSNVVYFDIDSYSENLSKYKVYPNDILIAMSGGTTGKIGINYTNREFYLNQRVGVFRENNNVLNHMFLFYYLHTKGEDSLKMAAGAAQPNLSTAQIKDFDIPIPTLSEQKEIVEHLDSSFAKIDKLKENATKNLEEAKALFQSALKDALEPKEGWEEKTLGELGNLKNGMNFRKNESGAELHILGVGDFGNLFSISNTENLPIISLNEMPSDDYLLENEDIVFVRSNGNKNLVGRCVLVYPNNIKTSFSGFCIRFRKNSDKVDAKYLAYFLKAPNTRKKIAGNGANISNLNQKVLQNLAIPFPSLPEQQSIVSFLDSLNEKLNTLQQNYSRICDECDALKQAILRQVFE